MSALGFLLDALRIEDYFNGCDFGKDEARMKEEISRIERELLNTDEVMLHDIAIDEIYNYLYDTELKKQAELENKHYILDNCDKYPSFEDLKPFGLGDCYWAQSDYNEVTPTPVDYSEPDFDDLTPIPEGMIQTDKKIINKKTTLPNDQVVFFKADLSKNKLYQKRMLRKKSKE